MKCAGKEEYALQLQVGAAEEGTVQEIPAFPTWGQVYLYATAERAVLRHPRREAGGA